MEYKHTGYMSPQLV